MRKLGFLLLFCATVPLLLPACGTYSNLGEPTGPNVFGGVRYDFRKVQERGADGVAMIGYTLDMPLSFVFDILLLPYTIFATPGSDDDDGNGDKDKSGS